MQRRLALIVVSTLASAAAVTLASAPAAQATDTSQFAVQIVDTSLTVPAASSVDGRRATLTVACPAGTTPIAGGASAANGVVRYQDYVNFGDGASVVESVDNYNLTSQVVVAYASCAATRWVHPTGRVVATPAEDSQTGYAGGYATCPTGSIALSARVDWNNTTNSQSIDNSGPTADLRSWFATGYNNGIDNYMFIDVQCVAASDFPGAFLVQSSWQNTTGNNAQTLFADCPAGMTVLNGGSYILAADGSVDVDNYLGSANKTYPFYFGWAVTADVEYQDTLYVSAWCVPNQAPVLSFISGPPSYTASATARIRFAATDPASAGGYTLSYSCGLGTMRPSACASPWTATVSEGLHSLYVTASTSDGRAATRIYTWTYDHTAPTVTMTAPTAPFSLTSPVAVGWTGSDGTGSGVSFYNVRYRQADLSGAFGPWQDPSSWQHTTTTSATSNLTAGVTQCFSAQAVDRAANTSSYSVSRCTAMPVDDAALTASSGWTTVNDAAYWNGTYTSTTTQNATLTLAGVHLDRVGIVAETCPNCGRVALLVGTTQVGTINLHSVTTQYQVVHALPKFSATVGDVTIKVLTSGKAVNIDGLAAGQR